MSVNRNRKVTVCLHCKHARPSEHSLFCPDCWTNYRAECARLMGFQQPEKYEITYSPTATSVADEYKQRKG